MSRTYYKTRGPSLWRIHHQWWRGPYGTSALSTLGDPSPNQMVSDPPGELLWQLMLNSTALSLATQNLIFSLNLEFLYPWGGRQRTFCHFMVLIIGYIFFPFRWFILSRVLGQTWYQLVPSGTQPTCLLVAEHLCCHMFWQQSPLSEQWHLLLAVWQVPNVSKYGILSAIVHNLSFWQTQIKTFNKN